MGTSAGTSSMTGHSHLIWKLNVMDQQWMFIFLTGHIYNVQVGRVPFKNAILKVTIGQLMIIKPNHHMKPNFIRPLELLVEFLPNETGLNDFIIMGCYFSDNNPCIMLFTLTFNIMSYCMMKLRLFEHSLQWISQQYMMMCFISLLPEVVSSMLKVSSHCMPALHQTLKQVRSSCLIRHDL